MNTEEILNFLNKDKLKNIAIINEIENREKVKSWRCGDSMLLQFESNDEDDYNIHFSCSDKKELQELMKNLPAGEQKFACIERWITPLVSRGKEIIYTEPCHKMYLPESVTVADPQIKITSIRPEDADLVNDRWPFKSENSLAYMQDRIKNGITGAIYDNGKIVAWCITHSDGSLGSMHVEEDYRRKKYAYSITSYMVNELRKENRIPFMFIVEGNEKSVSLSLKFGFLEVAKVNWLAVK